jgi:hypothetical protein
MKKIIVFLSFLILTNLNSSEIKNKTFFNFGVGIPLTGGLAIQTLKYDSINKISLFSFSTKGVMISFPIDYIINLSPKYSIGFGDRFGTGYIYDFLVSNSNRITIENKFVLIHQFGNILNNKFYLFENSVNLMGVFLFDNSKCNFLFYYGFGMFSGYSFNLQNNKIKMSFGGTFDFYHKNDTGDTPFYDSSNNIILKYASINTFLIHFGIEYRIQFNFEK